MKIDKNKLIDLLVEKTDMGRQEIEAQLDQLIERILDAAKRGKALEIKEFGLFYFDEEGELSFDPAEELSTEISFKYAGMKPVELKPERDFSIFDDEAEAEQEPEADSESEPELDEESESDFIWESKSEPEPETKPEDDFIDDDFEDDFEDDSEIDSYNFLEDIGDDDEDEDENPNVHDFNSDFKEKEDEDDSLYDPFAPEELEPSREESSPSQQPPQLSPDKSYQPINRHSTRKRRDNTGIIILAVIIILAILIGGYFYYVSLQTADSDNTSSQFNSQPAPVENEMTGGSSQTDESETESNDAAAGPMQGATESNQTPAIQEPEPQNQVSNENTPETDTSIAQDNQPLFGLMGTVTEEANRGYSIVLHSFTTEPNASQAANRLRADGYRVILNSRNVNGSTVWRVSVGQFETLSDAQQATTRLPEPYNTQNFIQRIRIN